MWPDLANFCLCGNILDKFGTVWVHFVCHWVTFLAPKACLDLHNSLCKMQYGSPLNYAGKKLSELENLLSHCILRSPFESEQILKNNLSIRSHWFRAIRLECILNRPSLLSLFLFCLLLPIYVNGSFTASKKRRSLLSLSLLCWLLKFYSSLFKAN